jgi:hypothetical protein
MEGLVGTRARVVGARMVRRAGLIAAVMVLSVVGAGCRADPTVPSQDDAVAPTVSSQDGAVAPTVTSRDRPVAPTVTSRDRPAGYACGPGTDVATARTIGVYVAVLQQLTGDPHAWLGRVLYVVDRAVPMAWVKDAQAPSRTDNNGAAVPSERRRPTAPRSTSTAPFTDSVKRCLTSGRFPNLPPRIRLVSGVEDPRVAKKQGQGPMAVVADGRVVELEGVPLKGNRLALAASSNGGGGLNAHGGLYILERRGGTWQVVDIRAQWIA